VRIPHAVSFWAGIGAVTSGVVLHLPMYLGARDMGYHLAGMPVDGWMVLGMALILVGVALSFYGLMPARPPEGHVASIRVRALDDARVGRTHVGLLIVMAIAITIDVMKPVTLGFVVPGMAKEYGLKSPLDPSGDVPVALLPLAGILGTVVGSFLWGWLGDRLGRRASILFAGVIFIGTAVCGSMPNYWWNFLMCFLMGLGVGGMLPITFAMMAETMPARHRGWLMVLIGGDVAGAYIITSWLAAELTPEYSWRILWLLGLPTGILLILLNRWIPESPRFLIATGRGEEAREVLARYGAVAEEVDRSELAIEEGVRSSFSQLLERHFAGLTFTIALFGISVGLITFGFQLWIPSNLQRLGFTEVTSDRILRDSALIGFPATFLIAWLYGFWSSKHTLILLGLLTTAALVGFALGGDGLSDNRPLLYALLVIPITGISSIQAVLIAYASETYPTRVRSRATGLAAGASKAGGVAIIAGVVLGLTVPSIRATALVGALPIAVAATAVAVFGVETRRRSLEDITVQELEAGPAVMR
jgi:putative MFS transporter